MSKISVGALVAALVMFVIPCTSSRAFLATSADGSADAMAQSPAKVVEVTFDGLMVFRKVGNHYEVGVLDSTVALGHKLHILVGSVEINSARLTEVLKLGNVWSLDVVTSSGVKSPDIDVRRKSDCHRLDDTISGQTDLDHLFDFCWIMDLENSEFHNAQLQLKSGKLKPIIRLNNGELYTKYKYDELERCQGPDCQMPKPPYKPFGFVAETIALRVTLNADEQVVLRVAGAGKEGEIARISSGDALGIYNRPEPKKDGGKFESHFHYYYDLFDPEVRKELRYDIHPKMGGARPLNRFPEADLTDLDVKALKKKAFAPPTQFRIFTYDDQTCGAIMLSKGNAPLQ